MTKYMLKTAVLTLCFLTSSTVLRSQTNSEPGRYDIVISEIMAKPTPEVGLPAAEYIELHNRLPHPCLLKNWRLTLGNTSKNLPDITLDSCGYAILIAQKQEEVFASICSPIYTLSSLSITDGGQRLTLFNSADEVVHYVNFKMSWHTESIKQEGGWSLEMINERWPCAGAWNWNSSTDPRGGTPGEANSISNQLNDNTTPIITGVSLIDSVTLRVHFSKTLSADLSEPSALFHTKPDLLIQRIHEVPPEFTSWDLHFTNACPQEGSTLLYLSGEMTDCGGNSYRIQQEIPFGRPRPPKSNDVIINEILTNPKDGEKADYIELYNRSDHIIDLKEMKIGYGGDTLPQKAITAVTKGWQLQPKMYVCLCRNKNITMEQYICKEDSRLIECDSLPDFAIGQGIIHLTDRSLRYIDRLAYSEDMHYDKLLTTKGVALERLYADRPTQDENNWRSAAESAGFGTPGYKNSQAGTATDADKFEVIPEVFSPNNDGFEDFTEVICTFEEEECRVNLILYNNRGHPIKHLANNVLCGSEARFRWDGDDDNQQAVPAGMYVVQIEYWNLRSQKTKRKRKVVSIYR